LAEQVELPMQYSPSFGTADAPLQRTFVTPSSPAATPTTSFSHNLTDRWDAYGPKGADQDPLAATDYTGFSFTSTADYEQPSNNSAGAVLSPSNEPACLHCFKPPTLSNKYSSDFVSASRQNPLCRSSFAEENTEVQRSLDEAIGEMGMRFDECRYPQCSMNSAGACAPIHEEEQNSTTWRFSRITSDSLVVGTFNTCHDGDVTTGIESNAETLSNTIGAQASTPSRRKIIIGCDECRDYFRSNARVVWYRALDFAPQASILRCEICGGEFWKGLSQPRRRGFDCNLCQKQFDRADRLLAHSRVHTGVKAYSCPHCGRSFSRKDRFSAHVKKKHPQELQSFYGYLYQSQPCTVNKVPQPAFVFKQ